MCKKQNFRIAALGALLVALAAPAAADIRFFFSKSSEEAGLTNPALAFLHTGGSGRDDSEYRLRDTAPAIGVPTIDPALGEYLYLWAAFEDEPDNRKIQGIHLTISQDENEIVRGVYLGNGDNSDDGGSLRWNYNSRTNDSMVLVAVETPGIRNRAADGWLYHGGSERMALLGAFKFSVNAVTGIRLGLEFQGVSYAGNKAPKVKLGGNDEQFDGAVQPEDTPTRWSSDLDANIVPEPATAVLLLLAGVALRRR